MYVAKGYGLFLLKFFGAFCLLYYGTKAVIGLSSPENSYCPFVARYLDFIPPFRFGLLASAKAFLSFLGFETFFKDQYTLSLAGGKGVRIVYSCIGYGIISFWLAFVFANKGSLKRKAAWMICGSLALCVINIFRVCLVLVAANQHWSIPLGWDHHTWFNLAAYVLIFTLIWLYDRSGKKRQVGVALQRQKGQTD